MDLKEINLLGDSADNHWYYASKYKAVNRLIATLQPSAILDVGAGGGLSRKLLKTTSAKEAWCVDIGYAYDFEDFEKDKPIHFCRAVDNIPADLVLLMDVLEHVEDDLALLQSYVNKVPHGATFLISVPAFQFLWSEHDIFLEHKRRYSLKEMEKVVKQAGLKVEKGAYYFAAVFPIATILRLADNFKRHFFKKKEIAPHSQLSPHHPITNNFLACLSSAELPFFLHNRLFGLTVFVLAKKI